MRKEITIAVPGLVVKVEDQNATDEALAKAAADLHEAALAEVSARVRTEHLAARLTAPAGPVGPSLR